MNIETDGNEDYHKLNSDELAEIAYNIDRDRYPKNYLNLQREIATRGRSAKSETTVAIEPSGEESSSNGGRFAMNMKSGNPALSVNTFAGLGESNDPMTMAGTINKTAVLLALVVIGAGWVWNLYFASQQLKVVLYLLVGSLGGFLVALYTTFHKQASRYTAPVYALLEGLALGGVSALYEAKQPGIALQAVGLTFGTLACMLVAYRFEIIKVTDNFKMGVLAATFGILLVYVVDLILLFFGHPISMIHESGYAGILFSLFVVCIAALNLVMDFDFIARGVASRSPKYMEWYSAFGLVVTLIWLYLEVLRLLAKRK
jgi:uncharacterized YccA/Bax inhibitor family protein